MGKEGKGKDEFYLDVKDPEIATLDKKTGMLTGLVEGETTVSFFKLFDYELVFDIKMYILLYLKSLTMIFFCSISSLSRTRMVKLSKANLSGFADQRD